MVVEQVTIKSQSGWLKKTLWISLIVFVILLILVGVFLAGIFMNKPKKNITITNPLTDIIFSNTNQAGQTNRQAVIDQAVLEFNESYINYLLVALGAGHLHKSIIYGNPVIEFSLDQDTWNAEIKGSDLVTQRGTTDKKDLSISISKQDAVEAILSNDIEQFMRDLVSKDRIQMEMIASKLELGSKGYLAMYKEVTGEDAPIEE